jgi:hypothetical protein
VIFNPYAYGEHKCGVATPLYLCLAPSHLIWPVGGGIYKPQLETSHWRHCRNFACALDKYCSLSGACNVHCPVLSGQFQSICIVFGKIWRCPRLVYRPVRCHPVRCTPPCPVLAAALPFVRFFAILLPDFFIFASWTSCFTFRLSTPPIISSFWCRSHSSCSN